MPVAKRGAILKEVLPILKVKDRIALSAHIIVVRQHNSDATFPSERRRFHFVANDFYFR
jgi:hypothetical protein